MNTKQLAALIENSGNIEASIVAEAAKKNQEQARERAIGRAQQALTQSKGVLNTHVGTLRNLRKQEKQARERVESIANGIGAFEKDGDTNALAKALYPDGTPDAQYYRDNFIRSYGAEA
jgi:hypothetical protein